MIRVVKYIAKRLVDIQQSWAIVGSANLFLRGCIESPGDLDIISTREGTEIIANKLFDHTVQAPTWSECDNIRSIFYVALIFGIRVEVMGEPINRIKGKWIANYWWIDSIEHISMEGLMVPCTTLNYEKIINLQLENLSRVKKIDECITKHST